MNRIDFGVDYLVVWVPGTGGHEVHPAFKDSCDKILKNNYQLFVVEYPAQWDLENSVPAGIEKTKNLLLDLVTRKGPNQKVVVAGSSQGAWVLSDALDCEMAYKRIHRAVLMGHPGLDGTGDHVANIPGEKIWEINHPNDAVTYPWKGREREITKTLSSAMRGDISDIFKMLWIGVTHPVITYKIVKLLLYHARILRFASSPHDYSQVMPLAVYWLVTEEKTWDEEKLEIE